MIKCEDTCHSEGKRPCDYCWYEDCTEVPGNEQLGSKKWETPVVESPCQNKN